MSTLASTHQRLLIDHTKRLTSLVNQSRHLAALTHFSKMFASPDLSPLDPFAFPLALKSSAALLLPHLTSSIHSHCLKSNLLHNPFVSSALITSYGKCDSLPTARRLFDESPNRNIVVWNAIISLYTHHHHTDKAISLFDSMDVTPTASTYNPIISALAADVSTSADAIQFYRRMTVAPNIITTLALLPACTNIGGLNFIKEIHGFSFRNRFYNHGFLVSGVVEAYGKCGCLVYARRVFDGVPVRDVVVWSAMVSAYAFHGQPEMAMGVFRGMEEGGVRPDGIMFLAVLKACSHAGLTDDARVFFEVFSKEYGIEAGSDHYSCFVDVLGRAGRLEEAYGVIQRMPVQATARTWGALLGACRNHGEVGLAEIAARKLFEIEPENTANFVLLASVYSAAGRFEEAESVRQDMEERGLKRSPGNSWVISKSVQNGAN